MSNRQSAGSIKALPVFDHFPLVGDHGTDLSTFSSLASKPANYYAKVQLTGGVSTQLVVAVRDANGWAIAAESGNLGVVAGQDLPTGKIYSFEIKGVGGYLEVALFTQNINGLVVVDMNTLQDVYESS